ncbi:CGNR zinc finger domain-containing protein [Bacillus gaemokensis]|uniref:PadR family transcriptional regulator n=1 Tax=Bacillus gaemokensis TaxID=574375 RepID=A0A073K9P3_9BACI|nr:CGNR zinc finger domain-containing protein [Bacillus gaemokensis]KEK23295.1 PadR family transcriptional regulator [Bacillus gaemokensis]KYG28955.1 PadR family transcriptional regulator [Bacillus gaemokensis]
MVVYLKHTQEAPGKLETIRDFLNTWRIPNDTRKQVDELNTIDDVLQFMREHFDEKVSFGTLDKLRRFRDEIRFAVEEQGTLQEWLEKYPFRVCVTESMDSVTYEPIGERNLYTMMLQIILVAIDQKQWGRLKACPDCRWVFYDHSRNGSKRWCGMYAGGKEGRACGTIAKVKNYRAKRKGSSGYMI